MFKVTGICGSPRINGNTEILLDISLNQFDKAHFRTEKILLSKYEVNPCLSCRYCVENDHCCIDDDMTNIIIPKLIEADAIIVASPVYFNNVGGLVKNFMDRTWCIRGKLKDKIGGGIVVGRRYGSESALTAIHAFMLKHQMILGHRGVSGIAYEKREILTDKQAIRDVKELANRLSELILHSRENTQKFE